MIASLLNKIIMTRSLFGCFISLITLCRSGDADDGADHQREADMARAGPGSLLHTPDRVHDQQVTTIH